MKETHLTGAEAASLAKEDVAVRVVKMSRDEARELLDLPLEDDLLVAIDMMQAEAEEGTAYVVLKIVGGAA